MKSLPATAAFASLVLCVTLAADAKRSPPPQVLPVKHGTLEYRVLPPSAAGMMPGFVEARDAAGNKQVWLRQIYVIRRDPALENDVQDVFINGLKLDADRNVLEVTNEAGFVYELDLKSLDVKPTKGQAVISRK